MTGLLIAVDAVAIVGTVSGPDFVTFSGTGGGLLDTDRAGDMMAVRGRESPLAAALFTLFA